MTVLKLVPLRDEFWNNHLLVPKPTGCSKRVDDDILIDSHKSIY
ncbi:hypothetical protein [Sulfurimonas sp. CS5]